MPFGSTAIHVDFFQDTKYRMYMTSIRIQNKDSNEEILPLIHQCDLCTEIVSIPWLKF